MKSIKLDGKLIRDKIFIFHLNKYINRFFKR